MARAPILIDLLGLPTVQRLLFGVSDLLAAIEDADPALLPDAVRDAYMALLLIREEQS